MGKRSKSKNWRKQNQSSFEASSSANELQASSHESDIPGYYYDEEKKNYFKILPNTMSSVGSFVTKETIKKKKEESRRQSDLSKERENATTSTSFSVEKRTTPITLEEPLLNTLRSVQCGLHTCQSLHSYLMRRRYQRLKPQPGWESGQIAPLTNASIALDSIQRMELNAACDKFIGLWSVKGLITKWMKFMSVTPKKKQNGSDVGSHLNLTIDDPGYIGSSPAKITSMCWSPLSSVPGKECVLYTTVCPIDYFGSTVTIFNLETSIGEEAYIFSFDLGRNSLWSCAWNQHFNRISVGCEKTIHIVDVDTRRRYWTYSVINNDCLSQLFSNTMKCIAHGVNEELKAHKADPIVFGNPLFQAIPVSVQPWLVSENPHLLYCGTRNGRVYLLDLRIDGNRKIPSMKQYMPVVCLRSLKDENYLFASDYSGLINRWDLRFQKTVMSYSGLVNSHYQIPFYIDSTEKFIYATGSDGYCKIWNVSDGSLLKSIAPPLPLEVTESIPVAHVSEQWGGLDGNFGVITGMANSFFMYS